MQVRTDDDVYRVDAVWLGPPKLTFPWRARYVSYAIGLVVMLVVMAVQRWFGIGFGVLSVAWATARHGRRGAARRTPRRRRAPAVAPGRVVVGRRAHAAPGRRSFVEVRAMKLRGSLPGRGTALPFIEQRPVRIEAGRTVPTWQTGDAGLPAQPRLGIRGIAGNLTRTERSITAWYRLSAHPWSFRGDAEREHLMALVAGQLGGLAGRHVRMRVTSRPYPVRRWAEGAHANAVDRPPTPVGSLSWPRFLQGEQRHLAAGLPGQKEVYLGVDLGGADNPLQRAVEALGGRPRSDLDRAVAEIGDLLTGPGLAAEPATPGELVWLLLRSLGLGLPGATVPDLPADVVLDDGDLVALAGQVALCAAPGDPTLTVLGRGTDGTVRRGNLVVLTVGQMEALHVPEADDPWMQRTDRLPFPVEWSARFDVRRAEDVSGELRRQMGKVRSQMRHYVAEHGEEPPTSLSRAADQVLAIEDELSVGLTQCTPASPGGGGSRSRRRRGRDARPRPAGRRPLPTEGDDRAAARQFRLAREFVPGERSAPRGTGARLGRLGRRRDADGRRSCR
ncbi:hypothetical protein [Pseudonocardia sp. ICBG601]|uniref:hypothetical protein n=1 Tax=Pseudonocardia sp. ICBG601 TaxID=2846759 RepID=UPI001CF6501A|nr:hypothetical protein [Pseudonocardia sp. ICBG601]